MSNLEVPQPAKQTAVYAALETLNKSVVAVGDVSDLLIARTKPVRAEISKSPGDEVVPPHGSSDIVNKIDTIMCAALSIERRLREAVDELEL